MTTINSQEDFLRALTENPQWREAVRAQLLGEELLQLPARFEALVERMDAFVEEQKQRNEEQKQHNARMDAFVERMTGFVEEQKQHNARMDAFVREQTELNHHLLRRISALTNDVGQVKGGHARITAVQDAPGIVIDMSEEKNLGLEYVRDVTRAELGIIAQNASRDGIPTNELRSFRRADLIIAAKTENGPCYITVEASFTATQRDASRAQRNAALLTRFTGRPAYAVISSVHNDRNAEAEIAAGNVWWHELEERDMEAE